MHLHHGLKPVIALWLGLFMVASAAGQSSKMVTIDEAVNLALAHNHSLQAQRTLILQNQAQEITANLRPNPTLDFDSAQFIPIFSPQYFLLDYPGPKPAI